MFSSFSSKTLYLLDFIFFLISIIPEKLILAFLDNNINSSLCPTKYKLLSKKKLQLITLKYYLII